MDVNDRQQQAQHVVSMTANLTRLLDTNKMSTRELRDAVTRCYLAGAAPETIVNIIILSEV